MLGLSAIAGIMKVSIVFKILSCSEARFLQECTVHVFSIIRLMCVSIDLLPVDEGTPSQLRALQLSQARS